MFSLLQRNYRAFINPPITVEKEPDALRFGILGAAKIAPGGIIRPAKTHKEVIVYCIAARDPVRAKEFARLHGIPNVKRTYQDVIDDPVVDCVYIPLPNHLHGEWALKALKAGKHVLVEKPSVANAEDARTLFENPVLNGIDAPVLLEAFHYRFQPSWSLFMKQIDRESIERVEVQISCPGFWFSDDDHRFKFDLAGGTIMDFGTYAISALRQIAGEAECIKCDVDVMNDVEKYTDRWFRAEWKLRNGGVGVTSADLKGSRFFFRAPQVSVEHWPVVVEDHTLQDGWTKTKTRKVYFYMYVLSVIYHYITVTDIWEIKDKEGRIIKTWVETQNLSSYTWEEAGEPNHPSENYWSSYRHQLEQFVNRVRGRNTTHWISPQDSIAQMEMIDAAYKTAGLPVRPSGKLADI